MQLRGEANTSKLAAFGRRRSIPLRPLRNLFRIFALLVAVWAAGPAIAGDLSCKSGDVILGAKERGQPALAYDLITRKHRHAGSLEEFFAIDDDSDQYDQSPAPLAKIFTWYTLVEETPRTFHVQAPRPHWPRAAFSTGPPLQA